MRQENCYDPTTNHFSNTNNPRPTYDQNGNLTYDVAHNYAWDADGNLNKLDSAAAMVYDALGRRVEQPSGGGTAEILYGPDGSKLAVMAGQTVTRAFLALPGGATAVYNSSGLAWYRHPDWLGSSRLASTPTTRTMYYDAAYSPQGEVISQAGTADRNFTGQNQDLNPGGDLYDFPYREYHASHGRWISPDPAGLAAVNPANPQSWNRYAYVNGSPLNSVDPLGLTPFEVCMPHGACSDHAQMPGGGGAAGAYGFSLNGTSTAALYWLGVTATTYTFTFDDTVKVSDPDTGALWAWLGQANVTSQTTLSYSDALLISAGPGGGTPGSVQTAGTAPAGTCPAGQTRMPNGKCDKPFPGGQELANGIAKGAGPAASPCFWVQYTAAAAATGATPLMAAEVPTFVNATTLNSATTGTALWGFWQAVKVSAGQTSKPSMLVQYPMQALKLLQQYGPRGWQAINGAVNNACSAVQ